MLGKLQLVPLTPLNANTCLSQNFKWRSCDVCLKKKFLSRSVLSRCGHAVLALLYPFTWQHTFIPVLPASMLDVSCSPTPFLIGVLSPCLPQLLELPIEEVGDPGRPLTSRRGSFIHLAS